MNRTLSRGVGLLAGVGAAAGAGVAAVRRLTGGDGHRDGQRQLRWQAVTIYAPAEQVAPEGRLPLPLAELGDAIETRLQPAPGDRGTELHARFRDGREPSGMGAIPARLAGEDPRQALRSALREAKQLVEVGELLQADRPGTTEPTITGAPLDWAIRLSGGEGRP